MLRKTARSENLIASIASDPHRGHGANCGFDLGRRVQADGSGGKRAARALGEQPPRYLNAWRFSSIPPIPVLSFLVVFETYHRSFFCLLVYLVTMHHTCHSAAKNLCGDTR